MQQRQLRLGDILDDYCPRERRVTNHVVVAMIGEDVKQTRCTTCDADHEFKHAKVPRQRRKSETPAALYAQVLATGPKRRDPRSAAGDGVRAPSSSGADEDARRRADRVAGARARSAAADEADGGRAAQPPTTTTSDDDADGNRATRKKARSSAR